jgi:hypothetical protein
LVASTAPVDVRISIHMLAFPDGCTEAEPVSDTVRVWHGNNPVSKEVEEFGPNEPLP